MEEGGKIKKRDFFLNLVTLRVYIKLSLEMGVE
jgi:hypothetical protein